MARNDYTIHSTTNYDKFKFLKRNRKTSDKHVQNLCEVMEKNDRLGYHPILVTEKDGSLFIRDGQHRFLSAKKLNKPIYYMIDNSSDLGSIVTDQTQRGWRISDFYHYHVTEKNPVFLRMQEMIECLQIPLASLYALLGSNQYELGKKFKKGDIKIPFGIKTFLEASHDVRKYLSEMSPEYKNTIERRDFIRAFFEAFLRCEEKGFKILCKRLSNHFGTLPNRADKTTYFNLLVQMRNKNFSKNKMAA